MGTRLFVGNLSYKTTEEELRQLFAGAGEVSSVALITERETGRPKGFAFVEMATAEDAQKAINELNGQAVCGRTIRVDLARPRQQGSGGGGFGQRRERGPRQDEPREQPVV